MFEDVRSEAAMRLPILAKAHVFDAVPGQPGDISLGVIWDACRQPEGGGLGYVFAFTGRRTGRILAWLDRRGRAYACDAPLTELPEGDPDVLLARWADDENAGEVEARIAVNDDALTSVFGASEGEEELWQHLQDVLAAYGVQSEPQVSVTLGEAPSQEELAAGDDALAEEFAPDPAAAFGDGAQDDDSFALGEETGGKIADEDLLLTRVATYTRTPQGRFCIDRTGVAAPVVADEPQDLRLFLARCFLSYVYLPRRLQDQPYPPTTAARSAQVVLRDLLEGAFPDALEALLYRVQNDRASSPFERYAAVALAKAGARRIRSIATRHDLLLRRLGTTGMFWAVFNEAELVGSDRACVLAVECALNRLALVARALRHSTPMLPDVVEKRWLAMADVRAVAAVGRGAAELATRYEHENPLAEIFGARAQRGGGWDVRTRFAAACEELALPFRLAYRFDVSAEADAVAVEFELPAAAALPSDGVRAAAGPELVGALAPELEGDAALLDVRAQLAFGARVAVSLICAAFGSGVGVTKVSVTGRSSLEAGAPALMTLSCERVPFATEVLPLLRDHAFEKLGLAPDPSACTALLGPISCEVHLSEDGRKLEPVSASAAARPERHAHLWEDGRPVPQDLRDPLCADTVADLDIFRTDDDVLLQRTREAAVTAHIDPDAAAGHLEDIVDAYEIAAAPLGDTPRLYCSDAVGRALTGLAVPTGTRFAKLPDSSFAARSMLDRLLRERGETEQALAWARSCIELAPTTATGYADAATILIDERRFDDAVELLNEGLRYQVMPHWIAYLRYRLAFAYWARGEKDAALACYVLAQDDPFVGTQARGEKAQLLRDMRTDEEPGPEEARACLARAGSTPAPTEGALAHIARAAIELVDAGLLEPAVPLVNVLVIYQSSDVLVALGDSLRFGLAPRAPQGAGEE